MQHPTDGSFLEYVAHDMLNKCHRDGVELSRVAVVFPGKRAALFMNEYLARAAGCSVWSPAYITISDFLRGHSSLVAGDNIKLVCDLHKSFCKCTGLKESLDQFYGWGQLLLSDFDDIDKNMADADKVFSNIEDLHDLDDMSYLTEEQRNMLRRFFNNVNQSKEESTLKKRFEQLWSHLAEIYHDYQARLRKQGIGYEGLIYREVAESKHIALRYDRYVFVGFNLLHKAEQLLFSRIDKEGKAMFYWDYDQYYMPKPGHHTVESDAGHYIASYLGIFRNQLDSSAADIYNNMAKEKSITFCSAPTENIQARYVTQWLLQDRRYAKGRKTAVVMADESMLLPIMHSLPEEVGVTNITGGFPLAMTQVASLVNTLYDLYTIGMRDNGAVYNLNCAVKALSHPYARHLSDNSHAILSDIRNKRQFYPSSSLLTQGGSDAHLAMLFAQWPTTPTALMMTERICTLLKTIATNAESDDPLFQESVFRMYTTLNRLVSLMQDGDLTVDTNTLRKLARQLVATTSIPFHGEPIAGVQVMGVLETRNLDFDHLLLLSCNEGNMPKGVNDSSFIPYAIRKAYGLTTIDNKVAIYSYYFHRLLQRAKDITIVYNNSTSDGHTGEKSRFMTQMMVESPHPICHASLLASDTPTAKSVSPVRKTEEMQRQLREMTRLSPSAINTYMRCPKRFFYQYVAHLKEPEPYDEGVDNRMFGNIFHKAAYIVYEDFIKRGQDVEKSAIERILSHKSMVDDIVDRAFSEEYFNDYAKPTVKRESATPDTPYAETAQAENTCHENGTSPNGVSARAVHGYNGIQIINREVIAGYLRQLLKADQRLAPFKIMALESGVYDSIDIDLGTHGVKTLTVGGIVDRLDMVDDIQTGNKVIRVVDYKTGRKPSSPLGSVDDVFDDKNMRDKHSDYYLQAMLYSLIISHSSRWNPHGNNVSPALLFIRNTSAKDHDPTLLFGSHKIGDVEVYRDAFMSMLKDKIGEMFNPDIDFQPTSDSSRCESCPFRMICYV